MPKSGEKADGFLQSHQEANEKLKKVTDLVDGFETPYGLELLASVHWLSVHDGEAVDSDSAVSAMAAWNDRKRRLFKPDHIRVAWDRLQGEEESGTRAEDLDLANDRFWKKISESFQTAFSLLQDLAEEEGADLDTVSDEPQADEPRVVHLLPSMAQRYALLVDEWVKNNGDWIDPEPTPSPNHLHLLRETPNPREHPISRKEALPD